MTAQSLTVAELLATVQRAVVTEFPSPVWVRGEVTGLRRTSRGAVFFRLADGDVAEAALEVAARGRVMMDIDRVLGDAGVGSLRDGVEVKVKGTVGVDQRGSRVRLALLEVDPAFTVGRMALDRAEVIRRMTADGSLSANGALPIPLVPLRVGLVTSRGSAAHADVVDQLRRSGFRFRVKTAHTVVQGELAAEAIAAALEHVAYQEVDVVTLVRGGGSKLDLAVFDRETVARAIAASPVPVITGIGHEIDRTVADEAAAIATKTPSAAGEWLVARVKDFADRLGTARQAIPIEARSLLHRQRQQLRTAVADVAGSVQTLRRQQDSLDRLRMEVARGSREFLHRRRADLQGLAEWFTAVDMEPTLRRGFAIVTTEDGGTVVRSADQVSSGDRLLVRLADGTVRVIVEKK